MINSINPQASRWKAIIIYESKGGNSEFTDGKESSH